MNPPVIAGATSTTIFALSTRNVPVGLPMLFKAFRTKDLSSYSLGNILLANAGNVVHYPVEIPHVGHDRRLSFPYAGWRYPCAQPTGV